jgi:Asp-tRNA(Asn)/Glu-tRNA(Gln) amidotransferase C subunit
MRLPVIKSALEFAEKNDEDFLIETTEVLEHLSQAKGIKDEEMMVIGELLSNIFGALEVRKDIKSGTPQKEALNNFMQRVMGSID